MKAKCSVKETSDGEWTIRHSSFDLGDVEVSGASREEMLNKIRDELQSRLELFCGTGEAADQVELEVIEEDEDEA